MTFPTLKYSRRIKFRNVRPQDGSEGCKRAQDNRLIIGCAGDVTGLAEARLDGSPEVFGNKIGERNGLEMSHSVFSWKLKDSKKTNRTYGYFNLAISPIF